ncbi:MAG: hypothetical protein ACXVCP_08355 [Bdellovibrio sp.]
MINKNEKNIIEKAGVWIGFVGGIIGIAGGITSLVGYFHNREIEKLQETRTCISDLSLYPTSVRQSVQDFTNEFFKWVLAPNEQHQISAKKAGVALMEQLEVSRIKLAKYNKLDQNLNELIDTVTLILAKIKSGYAKDAPVQDYAKKVEDYTAAKSFSEKCTD